MSALTASTLVTYEPRPFEQLDIAFVGLGFHPATVPVTDWRDNEDVLSAYGE
jgi:hypothetical protein